MSRQIDASSLALLQTLPATRSPLDPLRLGALQLLIGQPQFVGGNVEAEDPAAFGASGELHADGSAIGGDVDEHVAMTFHARSLNELVRVVHVLARQFLVGWVYCRLLTPQIFSDNVVGQ